MEERGELILVVLIALKLFKTRWLLYINTQVVSTIVASCVSSFSKIIVKIANTVTSLIILLSDAVMRLDVLFLNNTNAYGSSSLLRCCC